MFVFVFSQYPGMLSGCNISWMCDWPWESLLGVSILQCLSLFSVSTLVCWVVVISAGCVTGHRSLFLVSVHSNVCLCFQSVPWYVEWLLYQLDVWLATGVPTWCQFTPMFIFVFSQYPGMLSGCNISWMCDWPRESLLGVSTLQCLSLFSVSIPVCWVVVISAGCVTGHRSPYLVSVNSNVCLCFQSVSWYVEWL